MPRTTALLPAPVDASRSVPTSLAELSECESLATELRDPTALSALLNGLSSARSASVRAPLIHALRRVFTALHGAGRLAPVTTDAGAIAIARWLNESFVTFLELLSQRLARGSTDERVLALSTVLHFIAVAEPLAAQVERVAGPALSQPVAMWLARRLLAAGGPGSLEAANVSGWLANADLSAVSETYRLEFVDEFDDVRLAALRAVRDVCVEAAAATTSSTTATKSTTMASKKRARTNDDVTSTGGNSSRGVTGDSAGRALITSVAQATVARNAIDFLLGVAIPISQNEWDSVQRASWADDTVGESLREWRKARGIKEPIVPRALAAAIATSGARFLDDADSDDDLVAALKAKGPLPSSTPGAATAQDAALPVRRAFSWAAQRAALGEAWLAALRLPLPPDVERRVLLSLPRRILPLLPASTPLALAGWVEGVATARGGATAVIAAEALFALHVAHGLAAPRLYSRLYALLGSRASADARHRARFFALLDLSLASPALPGYLVAAFAKRAARVALTAPLGVALWALPFIYNLLRRHSGAVGPLLHTPITAASVFSGSGGGGGGTSKAWPSAADPFDASTDDPALCRALESSLWEVTALSQHYFAPVAHAARTLCAPPNAEEKDLSEGDGGKATAYADVAKTELTRLVKRNGGEEPAPVGFAFDEISGPIFNISGGIDY